MAYPISSEIIVEGDGADPGRIEMSDSTEIVGIQCPTTISASYTVRLPPALGTIGTVFSMLNATDADWTAVDGEVWSFRDQKPSGTGGGNLANQTWVTRALNNVSQSPLASTAVQLAVAPAGANQLLVQPGTYMVFGYSMCFSNPVKTALWNDDTATILIVGTSEYSGGFNSIHPYVMGIVTVAVQTVMSFRWYINATPTTNNKGGVPVGIPSVPEIYTNITFYKL